MARLINVKIVSRLGFWNVRTLNQPGRPELLADELLKFDIDIAIISEARLLKDGEDVVKSSAGDDSFKIFYSGGTTHENGVAFLIKISYESTVISFVPISDRIATYN